MSESQQLTGNHHFRRHRTHTLHRCGLLLQMSHVAWSVSVFGTAVNCAKTAESVEMPFVLYTFVWAKETIY